MKKLKKAAGIAASVLLWVVIVLAAIFAFTVLATRDTDRVADIAGYTPMVVKTESMKPTFGPGDMIIIKKCDKAALIPGDIICFHTIVDNKYALNTHRIVDIEDNGGYRSYVTRGDNNEIPDQTMIADADIVGKYVTKIGGMGSLIEFMSSAPGFILIIIAPLLAFLIYQVYHLIVISANLKKATLLEAKQAEEQAEDETERLRAEARRAREEAAAAIAEAERLREQVAKKNDDSNKDT